MKQEQIKAKAKEQFPNDEFKQQAVIDAINWATKELQEEIAYYKAREVDSGWSRPKDLKQDEFVELMYFLDDVYKEDKKLYEQATNEVNKNFDRMSVARCTTYEMLFRRMYIQAFREGGAKLTKAKDHIKKLLDCLKQDTNDPQTNYYVCQYMDKAEQFLNSEVENV